MARGRGQRGPEGRVVVVLGRYRVVIGVKGIDTKFSLVTLVLGDRSRLRVRVREELLAAALVLGGMHGESANLALAWVGVQDPVPVQACA